MSLETASILNHIMFHKALISDNAPDERIDRYLKIIEDMEKGMIIGIKDPTQRTIATIFSLVMEHKFDPWDINIAEFTKMYLKMVRQDEYVNFVTAGRLIFMAWSILKLQSDKVLTNAMPVQPAPDEGWLEGINVYQAPEDLDFTQTLVQCSQPPLCELMRDQPSRPVTLMELVNAFDEALKDAEGMRGREAQGRKIRAPNFHVNVHREDLNEDLELTWNRILEFNGSPIPLHGLCSGDAWDVVTVFMAVLFLAKMSKIKLWQKDFPFGEIFVKNLNGSKTLDIPEMVKGSVEQKGTVEKVEA